MTIRNSRTSTLFNTICLKHCPHPLFSLMFPPNNQATPLQWRFLPKIRFKISVTLCLLFTILLLYFVTVFSNCPTPTKQLVENRLKRPWLLQIFWPHPTLATKLIFVAFTNTSPDQPYLCLNTDFTANRIRNLLQNR